MRIGSTRRRTCRVSCNTEHVWASNSGYSLKQNTAENASAVFFACKPVSRERALSLVIEYQHAVLSQVFREDDGLALVELMHFAVARNG